MTTRKRRDILLAVLVVAAAMAALWAYGRCGGARVQADRAGATLARSRSLAKRIEHLRHRPNLAGAEALQLDVLAKRAEDAAKAAGMPTGAIAHVWRNVRVKGHVEAVQAKLAELQNA